MDVVLVLEKEPIDKLAHLLDVPIVNGVPGSTNDFINLLWVCGVRAWCLCGTGPLYCLEWLGALLLDVSVDK